jgi:hypothetical protein
MLNAINKYEGLRQMQALNNELEKENHIVKDLQDLHAIFRQ